MNQFDDRDNPDDSAEPRHDEGIGEETSATGQRVKGRTKDILGEITGDESLEEKGERENQAGRERQKKRRYLSDAAEATLSSGIVEGPASYYDGPAPQSILTLRLNCWFSLQTNSIISSSTVTR